MGSDLEAAVARLERDLDAIAAETPGAREARGDVRLLLADWQRLRELTSPAAGWSRLEKELSTIDTPIAERDAARAEVERLRAEAARIMNDTLDSFVRLGTDLARLRERDARVRTKVEALQQCIHSEACMTSEDGWTSHHPDCQELREALALLKETP